MYSDEELKETEAVLYDHVENKLSNMEDPRYCAVCLYPHSELQPKAL